MREGCARKWRDVKLLVDAVYSEPIGAEIIVEAILLSASEREFFELVAAAEEAAAKFGCIVYPGEDDNA
jgi:hypothetical protein